MVVAVTPLVCSEIYCAHNDYGQWQDNVASRFSCFYGRRETGEERARCDEDFNYDDNWPLDFDPMMTPMNKCIKPPGLAAFKRCNDKDNCNKERCNATDVVPWPETYTTTFETTIEPSTEAPTTPATVTVEARKAPIAISPNGTSNETDPNCENGKRNNQTGPLGLPLTNVYNNKQVNVVYNVPSTSNSCECRCNQSKGQNNYIAL
uniref:Uncharacterized protein n=1 Tax=Panagrellus redivivus TaxID=6233 RepID=A0A7E4V7Z0_PANRE